MSQIHIFRFLKINAMTVYPPTLRYLKGTSNKTYLKANSWSRPPDLILFRCTFFFNLSKSETWTSNLSLVFKLKTFLNSYLNSLSLSLSHTHSNQSPVKFIFKIFLGCIHFSFSSCWQHFFNAWMLWECFFFLIV